MGSCITENQFMIHILNKLTSDYDLQLKLMERRVGDADKPYTVEEVRGKLNLRFERLNMKTSRNEKGSVLGEQALFSGQFKRKMSKLWSSWSQVIPVQESFFSQWWK
jgi:hypothetical protein